MSRTPEKITDRKAQGYKSNCYVIAIILALISWVSFSNDAVGNGFLFAVAAFILFRIAGKIKTTLYKTHEVGNYVRR